MGQSINVPGGGGGGGATVAGSNSELQFNSSGSLGADSQLRWDSSSKTLKIGTGTLPSSGYIGVPNVASAVTARNHANTSDLTIFGSGWNAPSGNYCYIGTDSVIVPVDAAKSFDQTLLWANDLVGMSTVDATSQFVLYSSGGAESYVQAALSFYDPTGTNYVAQTGDATIANIDTDFGHSPATVRYGTRVYPQPINGATETTAIYCRLPTDYTGSIFQYGLYIEVPPTQNYTYGGCATKVIHRGHGDAHFVALLNGISPRTLEEATNASPIVCKATNHGFATGNTVTITGALGNTAANGTWYGITVTDADHFSLPSSTGSGAYTANSGTAQNIDPPVGYEAAHWGDGCTGFLSSMQYPGGRANAVYFNGLVQADAILNYGVFVSNDTPNASFTVFKRTGLADSTLDGYSQIRLLESSVRLTDGDGGGTHRGSWLPGTAYSTGDTVVYIDRSYIATASTTGDVPLTTPAKWTDVTDTDSRGRSRFAVYNSGRVDMAALTSTATTTARDAPELYQVGSYYSAGATHDYALLHKFTVTGTAAGQYRLYFGDPGGSPTVKFIFKSDGTLDLQNGDLAGVHTVTFKTADATNSIDLQTGGIANCTNITGTVVNIQTSGTQFDHYVNGTVHYELAAPGDGETALLLRRNVGGSYSLQRVSMGADDSGGTGYKVLRVPN
jgi:hypothetical protein